MNIKKLLMLALATLSLAAAAQAVPPLPTVDRGTFTGAKRSLNTKLWGYTIVQDTGGGAPTRNVERFEVRPGDCGSDPGWSDCANDRERSEISFASDNFVGSDQWYQLYILVPANYKNVFPTKVDFFQFFQPDSASPIWMFQNSTGGIYIDRQINHKDAFIKPIITAAELNGRWHKIEMHIKWSKGADGLFTVFIDGTTRFTYTGATMETTNAYMKYGIYRTYLTRYEAANHTTSVPGQVLFFTSVKRANTRDGLK